MTSVQITGAESLNVKPVMITEDTQEYVRQLEHETFLGEVQDIGGTITKLYPNRFIAEIKIEPKYYVKVYLNPEDFDVVRYQTRMGDVISFTGRPLFRLGQETTKIREFEVLEIKEIKNQEW